MEVDPPEPSCRRRLQTAELLQSKAAVVNVTVKRRGKRSRHVETRETSESDPLGKASQKPRMAPKPGLPLGPGSSMEGTYLLAMRCPVQKRRESSLGFRTELENRAGR